MAAYYYNDPSGLGSWYVQDGQTPADAFDQLLGTQSPILRYSVENTPAAHVVNGGNPSPATKASPPAPTGYKQEGATVRPIIPPLTDYQKSNLFKPRSIADCDPELENCDYCPDGSYWQLIGDVGTCVPLNIIPVPGGGSQGGTGEVSQGSVYVTVNNALDLSSGVGQAIGDTINQDIQSNIDSVNASIKDTTDTIQSTLGDVTSKIGGLVDGIIQNVYKALQWLGNLVIENVSKIVGFISDNIGKLATTISDTVTNVIIPLAKQINSVINQVNDVLKNTIAPVFTTIQQVYQQTNALIDAIKRDVDNGLQGILQIPTDITNSITAIEGDISRVINQIGLKKKDGTSVFLGPDGNDSVWDRLQTIGHGVGIIGGITNVPINFDQAVKLSEPDLSQAGAAALAALGTEINSLVSDLLRGGRSSLNVLATAAALSPTILGIEVGTWIGWWELIRNLDQMFEPFFDFAKEDLRGKAGLSKLPVGQVLEAWRRKLVDDKDLAEDLAVNGWNSGRIQVLKDLQQYLSGVQEAIDLHHRGIINDQDFTLIMSRNGVTGEQQQALLEQHLRVFDVGTATLAYKWNLIDVQALDAVLKENRYTDEEITIYKATIFQHETVEDVIGRERRTILYANSGFSPEGFSTPSQATLEAASRDGIDSTKALDAWQASYFVPPLEEFVVGYFRNILTLDQLNAGLDYYRVSTQWRDLIINTHRQLIPWRTIPTMLANGIIDEPYAKSQLQAHGFDLVATEALLKYASIATKKKVTAASSNVLNLSVATARGYFDAGTITADQYIQVLEAHGYGSDTARLVVSAETNHAAMLARKQLAKDLVNEVIAGTITIDSAAAMMDAHQFSPAEKARALNEINRAKRQVVKQPSEAELHQMAKAGAISVDDYQQGMKVLGWSDSWISNFVKWRFGNATQTAVPA